jgi:hypothetical protein
LSFPSIFRYVTALISIQALPDLKFLNLQINASF